MSTNVNVIDPNELISQLPNYMNGAPDYEKMHIFVELTAQRKKRTVLQTSGNGVFGATKLNTGFENDVNISMMGYDQTTKDTQHTTKYVFNTAISENAYEGFGIETIKIDTNSSYVPKVTIDFVDIRGNSFAQTKDAIYNVLFDFPPPIYKLTVKGYFGRALTYELHLIKYNVNFASDTGNYHIAAEFVARTFAPLTDILFKYVEMFPFVDTDTAPRNVESPTFGQDGTDDSGNPTTSNPNVKARPSNTRDLITKLQSLYDKITVEKDTSKEGKELRTAEKQNNILTGFNRRLNNFTETYDIDNTIKETGEFIIFNKERIDGYPKMEISNLPTYNTFLSNKGSQTLDDNISRKLYIGYPIGKRVDPNEDFILIDPNKSSVVGSELQKLRQFLLDDVKEVDRKFNERISPKLIEPTPNDNTQAITYGIQIEDETTGIVYKCIDINRFYQEVYLSLDQTSKTVKDKEEQLIGKINETVIQQLGMKPTIYNIFEILCDDIDGLFDKIKTVSIKAEEQHEEYKEKIITSSEEGIKEKNVTAFPLFIKKEIDCNVVKKVRRMPTVEGIGYNNGEIPEFPEANLVEKFMDAFIDLEKDNLVKDMKTQKDVNGNSRWIPVSAIDSVLHLPNAQESPYYSLFNTKQESINRIYDIFLNRFYVQSQFTYGYDFFREGDEEFVFTNQNKLVEFLAKSEAVNIANSISENTLIEGLQYQINNEFNGTNGYQNFLTYLDNNNVPSYSTLENPNYLRLTNNSLVFRDRSIVGINNTGKLTGYSGVDIITSDDARYREATNIRSGQNSETDKTVNPIDNFLSSKEESDLLENWVDSTVSFVKTNILGFEEDVKLTEFTPTNIPTFPDYDPEEELKSRYILKATGDGIGEDEFHNKTYQFNQILDGDGTDQSKITETAEVVEEVTFLRKQFKFKRDRQEGSFIESWSKVLGYWGTDALDFFTGTTSGPAGTGYSHTFKTFIITSNFFKTISYFNTFVDVNDIMKFPALVDLPYYSPLYMGGLVKISKDVGLQAELVYFMNSDFGKEIRYDAMTYVPSDVVNVKLLSEIDANAFEDVFNKFNDESSDTSSLEVMDAIIDMIEFVEEQFKDVKLSAWGLLWDETIIDFEILGFNLIENIEEAKEKYYKEIMTNGNYTKIPGILTPRTYMLNFSQLTFNKGEDANPSTFRTLSELNEDPNKTTILTKYFDTFFKKLSQTLTKNEKELNELEQTFKSNIDDNDIKTQTYYSFKNINDKWISGGNNKEIYGFPFNRNMNDRLINKFAFVDRAMNPIGDEVIINAASLIDMIRDYDLNMFTVFSRLLSENGFEFFPLQNFMAYEEGEWNDAFRIFEAVENQTATPSFVCMYIGGTSSYLDNKASDYDDDGLDLNNITDVQDFGVEPCSGQTEVITKPAIDDRGKIKYPYGQVRAFRVRYAEQNQSVFQNINIDSREYPETNESLAILSKIAQDNSKSTPVAKAQNLYNVFETRAYSAKIDMLGDAMIQPTQYFQLENIPIFSGAYVILDVSHTIAANKMNTSFTGVKVLKFPNPLVKEFATVVGKNSGTSQDISGNKYNPALTNSSWGDLGSGSLPDAVQHNSMFTLKLKEDINDLSGE